MLPAYLNSISDNVVDKGNKISFDLKCLCESRVFFLAKNKIVNDKNDPFDDYWKSFKVPIFSICSAIDKKTKKQYFYGTTFFGIRVGKFYDENLPINEEPRVVKVKCYKCGNEFTIFDSRYYGYDAIIDREHIRPTVDEELVYSWSKNQSEIKVEIYNDLDMQEFLEEFQPEYTIEDYSNAFTNIIVYQINKGKKKKAFEEETA